MRNIAIEGTFDDCQDLVKAMFADAPFRDEMQLSAVNSINWARIMAQIVYYVAAAVALGAPERRVAFAVPTGNFGNVYAAYAARRHGPADREADRRHQQQRHPDALHRRAGAMKIGQVQPTLSPSMDIQVSSNAERLLFELYGRDAAQGWRDAMTGLRARPGDMALDPAQHAQRAASSPATGSTTAETLATMAAPLSRDRRADRSA